MILCWENKNMDFPEKSFILVILAEFQKVKKLNKLQNQGVGNLGKSLKY